MNNTGVLIAGPTASGKSALALEFAKEADGIIINADSMQVYDVLNVLSARPSATELAQADHRLYGFVPPDRRFSTGAWLREVKSLLESGVLAGRKLIFVGGTGLYFQALVDGFTHVPPVAPDIVVQIEREVGALDRAGRQELLRQKDPEMALRLVEPDRQRMVRALSVLQATGRSLAHWQDARQVGLLDEFQLQKIVISPDREVLRNRIAQRFSGMMQIGGVEEVQQILSLELDKSLPVMKAIGVREISAWLAGDIARQEAISLAVTASHQYAKRQRTWFRKQMGDWNWRA